MAATTKGTTCLLCSLCCPAGVAFDRMGLAAPAYPGHRADAHHGLCYRGHFIADLVVHPSRLHEALVRDGDKLLAMAPRAALARAAALLPSMHPDLGVIVDGNLPCGEIAAAVQAAREGLGLDRVAIFIPPADEAMLRGLAASSAPRLGEKDVAECDVLLAVGDPFATHPLIASPALDALKRARGNRLLNVDSVRGHTARFATDFCQVRAGGEAAALAGLVRAVCGSGGMGVPEAAEMAGTHARTIEALAGAVRGAKKLGVLLSLPEGRCAAGAAASALAGKLAEGRGGVCPLLTYGNAAGARRLEASLGTLPLAQLAAEAREGRVRRLIVLGTDIASALPGSPLSSAEIVLAGSALPTPTTARAWFVVPMALWFELGGTVVSGEGVRRRAEAVAEPPRGALSPSGILMGLGAQAASGDLLLEDELEALLGAEPAVDLAEALGEPSDWAPPAAEGRLVLVSRADGRGFADGSLTAQLAWQALMEGRPAVLMNPADAAGLEGGKVTLRSNGAAATLLAQASADVPAGVAAISPRLPEARALFAWAETATGPGLVSLEKSSGNDR